MTNNFEIFVTGKERTYLVHSRMKKNHKLFADESPEHLKIVKKSIQDIISGKEPVLAESRKKEEKEKDRIAREKEEEAARKKEEAEKLQADLAAQAEAEAREKEEEEARQKEEEEKKKKQKEEEAKKKKEEAAKKAAEAAAKRKKAAEAKAKAKAKEDEKASLLTASTTASVQSAEGLQSAEGSEEKGEEIQKTEEVQKPEEVKKSEEKIDTPQEKTDAPQEQAAPEAEANEANKASEAKMAAYIAIQPVNDSSQATTTEKSVENKVEVLPPQEQKAASEAGGDGTNVRWRCGDVSDHQTAKELLSEAREREAARAKAEQEARSSFFGLTCCAPSKMEDSSGEAPTIKAVEDDLKA